jgi:hypothetical protein
MLRPMIALSLAVACSRQPSRAVAPAAEPVAPAADFAQSPSSGTELSGTIVEKIDASQYSYLRLRTASGEVWAAVPKAEVQPGAQVTVSGAMWMTDFKSATLGRTWPRIAFGVLGGQGAAPAPGAGHSPGMFAQAAMQSGSGAQGGSASAPPPDGTPISVARAAGKDGHTIAEIFAQKNALAGKRVRVRGKVVKETDGVLGKNWLHLRDGTGKGGAADLAVATEDSSSVGETVLVTGVVHLDRDLGAGYHYDVIIEDARVEPQPEAQR